MSSSLTVFNVAIVLFLIMDPLGNVAAFLSMVKEIDPRRQKMIIVREMFIALTAMIIFNYLGEFLFGVLGISEPTVMIASGVILFLVAIKILFPTTDSLRANLPKEEPFVVPLAIPLIAGPSLLATIMLYAHMEESQSLMLGAILLAWACAMGILLLANPLQKLLGNNGLMACERLMGMILVLLSIQRFLEGVEQFIPLYCQK